MNTCSADRAKPEPVPAGPVDRSQWEVVHLFTLCGFVFAQPILDRLQHNSGYIVQEQLTGVDVAVIAVVILIGPPLVLCAVELLARLAGTRCRRGVHLGIVCLLLTLLIVGPLNAAFASWRKQGWPVGILALLAATGTAAWLTRVYARRNWMFSLLSLAACGLLVFPWRFFTSSQISAVYFPPPAAIPVGPAGRPVPIVVVVFDGLCGMTLLDADHEVDAVRYPNFARLSQQSTWYRNATTVHYRTDNAVPAILTGRIPPGDREPVLAEYPLNLFTLLQGTGKYEQVVFEPYTRLCPPELRGVREQTSQDRITGTLWTVTAVYLDTTIPHDVWLNRPEIPVEWFRMARPKSELRQSRTGLINYGWDSLRHDQVDHFLDCLSPAAESTLYFLHVALPHYPWIYLPGGRRCAVDSSVLDSPLGCHGILREDWGPDELATQLGWQRYLLQTQHADHELGRVLDRLEATGLLNRGLLVVVADHGEAFVPGRSRREPTRETLPAIAPVPLFIKQPHQTAAERTDRNVETIDILPTIADILELELPGPVDGVSLLDNRETARPLKTMVLPGGRLQFEADFPSRYDYVADMTRTFGVGDDALLRRPAWRPEWLGLPVTDFEQGPRSRWLPNLEFGGAWVDPRQPEVIPCYFQGLLTDASGTPPKSEVTIVVAVNGQIAGATRTLRDRGFIGNWGLLTDERRFHVDWNAVEVYEVLEQDGTPRLCLCEDLRAGHRQ